MKKIEQQNSGIFQSVGRVHRESVTHHYDIIRIYFTEEGIGGISDHIEELEAIRSAGPNDVLEIHVSDNPGGSAGTIVTLVHALISTPAHTICVLNGNCASAATFIPLVCSETVVGPYATMMCHSCAGGVGGIMANQERSATFFAKHYSDLMDDIYENFLDENELSDLKKGLEIYLNSEEIEERLQRRAELLAAEAEEECDCGQCSLDACDNPFAEEINIRITDGLDDATTLTSEEVGDKVKESFTEEAKKRAPAKKKAAKA